TDYDAYRAVQACLDRDRKVMAEFLTHLAQTALFSTSPTHTSAFLLALAGLIKQGNSEEQWQLEFSRRKAGNPSDGSAKIIRDQALAAQVQQKIAAEKKAGTWKKGRLKVVRGEVAAHHGVDDQIVEKAHQKHQRTLELSEKAANVILLAGRT